MSRTPRTGSITDGSSTCSCSGARDGWVRCGWVGGCVSGGASGRDGGQERIGESHPACLWDPLQARRVAPQALNVGALERAACDGAHAAARRRAALAPRFARAAEPQLVPGQLCNAVAALCVWQRVAGVGGGWVVRGVWGQRRAGQERQPGAPRCRTRRTSRAGHNHSRRPDHTRSSARRPSARAAAGSCLGREAGGAEKGNGAAGAQGG